MSLTTDINDWCFAEALGTTHSLPPTVEQYARMYEQSPISSPIIRPVLLNVGAKDLRCPPAQSVEVYKTLKYNGVDVKMCIYPEDNHGLPSLKASVDTMLQTVQWFRKYIS
jgi:dipeptidyl aminopeptidase/acylaminoacyl peptidase